MLQVLHAVQSFFPASIARHCYPSSQGEFCVEFLRLVALQFNIKLDHALQLTHPLQSCWKTCRMVPRVGQNLALPKLFLFVWCGRDHYLEHGALPEVSHGAGPAYTRHQTTSGRQTQQK